jgi:hypothetical protein
MVVQLAAVLIDRALDLTDLPTQGRKSIVVYRLAKMRSFRKSDIAAEPLWLAN